MKKTVLASLAILLLSGCVANIGNPTSSPQDTRNKSNKKYTGKKILYIDSYHQGYTWSDGITAGVRSIIENTGADLEIHRMDTKRNTSEEFKKQAALNAKTKIENYKPDVVITSDDNAFKYLVMPYYRDAALPIVFCGLNWDASVYGAPYTNTTGMIEVSLINQIIDHLKNYAQGERVGFISSDTLSEEKNIENYENIAGVDFTRTFLAGNMDEWKQRVLDMQKEVDILFLENNAGIKDWDDDDAENFIIENIEIPVGTPNDWMMPYALLGLTKVNNEQGEWAALAALRILDGEQAAEIPLVKNKKGTLLVNLEIANKLNIAFHPSLLKQAIVYK